MDVPFQKPSLALRRIEEVLGSEEVADTAVTAIVMRYSAGGYKSVIQSPAATVHDCSKKLGCRSRKRWSGLLQRHSQATSWNVSRPGMNV